MSKFVCEGLPAVESVLNVCSTCQHVLEDIMWKLDNEITKDCKIKIRRHIHVS